MPKPSKKRRVVWTWICCLCGTSSIPLATEHCPSCGCLRCAACDVNKQTRGYPLPVMLKNFSPQYSRFGTYFLQINHRQEAVSKKFETCIVYNMPVIVFPAAPRPV
ncbi:hypothetical protein GQ53DRAFT_83030 [Thozetella sp. PMI_491]|nr:hypothetical protein GQ53DRAFT_83030 [Thozetella sp. PMI_491]